MDKIIELDLSEPVAAAGGPGGVWIADGMSLTMTCFDAANASPKATVELEARPVDLQMAGRFIVAGLADGTLVWYDADTADEVRRGCFGSGDMTLRSGGDRIWAHDRSSSETAAFDPAGHRFCVQTGDVVVFTAGTDGIYWISPDGFVWHSDGETSRRSTARLPVEVSQTGAMVSCSNALWVSVTAGLVLVSLKTLDSGPIVPAPEGPILHLICDVDGRIIGGSQDVFIMDPAADAGVRRLGIALSSKLRALAAAGDRIWALESAQSIVHILHIP